METLEIEVTRTDEYKILIDPEVWTKESIKDWASTFVPAESTEDIAKHLATSLLNLGVNHGFYEGFGYVKLFYPDATMMKQYKGKELIKDEDYCKGISVYMISVDDEYEALVLHPIV